MVEKDARSGGGEGRCLGSAGCSLSESVFQLLDLDDSVSWVWLKAVSLCGDDEGDECASSLVSRYRAVMLTSSTSARPETPPAASAGHLASIPFGEFGSFD